MAGKFAAIQESAHLLVVFPFFLRIQILISDYFFLMYSILSHYPPPPPPRSRIALTFVKWNAALPMHCSQWPPFTFPRSCAVSARFWAIIHGFFSQRERRIHRITLIGRQTEQVKTGQVNPDRPLVGPSVNTFVGRFVGGFVGSPRRAENREIKPRGSCRGRSRGRSRGRTRGSTRGPTRGATRGPTRGSRFAFACSVSRPLMFTVH